MNDAPTSYKGIIDKYIQFKKLPEVLPLVPPAAPAPELKVDVQVPKVETAVPVPSPEVKPKIIIEETKISHLDILGNIFKFTALLSFLGFLTILGLVFSRLYQKQNIKNSIDNLPRVSPTIVQPTQAPSCLAGDKTYTVNEIFDAADGSVCTCKQDLNIECEKKGTQSSATSSSSKFIGCEYKGDKYQIGESYKVDCNTCLCMDSGTASCTKISCKK